jgi:hypothetical protein
LALRKDSENEKVRKERLFHLPEARASNKAFDGFEHLARSVSCDLGKEIRGGD